MRRQSAVFLAAVGAGLGSTAPSGAVTFNISSTGNAQADAGFQAAAQLWRDRLADDITVNITAGFASLGPGVLGSASSTQANYGYASVRGALLADAFSPDDLSSSGALATGSFGMLLNRTANNPNGPGSAAAYFDNDGDANNTTVRMSNANAKALGLLAPGNTGADAAISFSSDFAPQFDFDRGDGIAPGAYDFVGIAAHEIGHALGFISGVDILDVNSPPFNGPFNDNQFTFVSTLDLFRFSGASVANGAGVIDWTADARAKYFSVDGGLTPVAAFSIGNNFGDEHQASHWKDDLGIGLLDPTAGFGTELNISETDLRAFDVIGFTVVPEPAGLSVLALGALAAARRGRRGSRAL